MKDVEITRSDLLEKLQKNRRVHDETYEEAHRLWRKEVASALGKAHTAALVGKEYKTHFDLPEPQSHRKDYDRAIQMVELDVRDTFILSQREFAQYVQDDWDWKDNFVATTSMYSG